VRSGIADRQMSATAAVAVDDDDDVLLVMRG